MYNPFSENSKALIRETGNVEYFELCETDSQVQCLVVFLLGKRNCILYLWHLPGGQKMRRMNTIRFDTMSITDYVVKKGVGHGARHGKSAEQLFYHQSFNAWKRCRRHQDESGAGILHRFQRDPVYRASQELIGLTEALCKEMDQKAQEDRTYKLTSEELARYKSNWSISLNNSGCNAPMAPST